MQYYIINLIYISIYLDHHRLLVVASNVNDGIKDILDEFEENWKDFVLGDENAMGRDALELREKFGAIVPRRVYLDKKEPGNPSPSYEERF